MVYFHCRLRPLGRRLTVLMCRGCRKRLHCRSLQYSAMYRNCFLVAGKLRLVTDVSSKKIKNILTTFPLLINSRLNYCQRKNIYAKYPLSKFPLTLKNSTDVGYYLHAGWINQWILRAYKPETNYYGKELVNSFGIYSTWVRRQWTLMQSCDCLIRTTN